MRFPQTDEIWARPHVRRDRIWRVKAACAEFPRVKAACAEFPRLCLEGRTDILGIGVVEPAMPLWRGYGSCRSHPPR